MTIATSPLASLRDPNLLKSNSLVGGKWVKVAARFAVGDPATGLRLADVANLGVAVVQQAIAAAAEVWPTWRAKSTKKHSAVLRR